MTYYHDGPAVSIDNDNVAHGLKTAELKESIIDEITELTEHFLSVVELAESSASARGAAAAQA
ncbi:MAG TPA: hypothetical protein VFW87_17465 [Pirellulales bacterium]|nr:hypothetical protein [Pirellulales bacterium]